MAKITVIDSTTFETPQYKPGDEQAITPIAVNSTFTLEGGRVESLVYDLGGNLLDYNPNAPYAVIQNGSGGNIEWADALEVYPEEAVSDLGLEIGQYRVLFNFLNNELDSAFSSPFSIKEISANRKEIRLTTSFSTSDDLQELINKIYPENIISPSYPDFYLNFGQNKLAIANNIVFDNSNNQYSVLVKLYEPLPSYAEERDAVWIATKQRDSVAYQVEFEQEILPSPKTNVLKGPNFSLPINNQTHTSVQLTGLDDLLSDNTQLNHILEKKGVTANIDYTNFDNFIHFSSAKERVKNFYYKVSLLESASNALAAEPGGSDTYVSASSAVIENKIKNIIQNFDSFEYWMYYNSSSDSNVHGGVSGTSVTGSRILPTIAEADPQGLFDNLSNLTSSADGTLSATSDSTGLVELRGYSFNIPSNATINGIEVKYKYQLSAPDGVDFETKLRIGLGSFGTVTNDNNVTTDLEKEIGGPTNTLGLSLTPTNIDNIRLVISMSNPEGDDVSIVRRKNVVGQDDVPSIRVYYTTPSSPSTLGSFPSPWPKSTSTKPYTLYSIASSEVTSWYNAFIATASIYDDNNTDNLLYTIPEYLREDSSNEPYEKFINMIGQHFDTLFTYAKDITNRYSSDNRLDFGLSKDLVGDAIQSMGINLYTGNFNALDLQSALVGVRTPSTLPDGQTNVTNYVTASSDVVPVEDVNKEIYKRIYHNLPLLLRQKGSVAGLRTLITCFGIPKSILDVKEYDIDYIGTTQNNTGTVTFPTESIELPPSLSTNIPPTLLSPSVRVQQNMLKSESYNRSLHYTEVGYSPANYVDDLAGSPNPFDSFPSYADFYFGSNTNYYGSGFVTGPQDTGTQDFTWNIGAFIRYIKFFDSSLFSMIKDFVPVRSSTATGVIIKPTLKERQRQRPAQGEIEVNTYTASADVIDHLLTEAVPGEGLYIHSPIGDYTRKKRQAQLGGSYNLGYRHPGSTGGSLLNLNQVGFAEGESDWRLDDLKTPVAGVNTTWYEKPQHN